MKNVYFIRHAQSLANAGHPTGSDFEIGLSEKDIEQARALGAQLNVKPDLILTTAYPRTLETARPIIEKWPNVSRDVWPLHEFTYLDTPTCIGITTLERRPRTELYWTQCDPDYCDGPGAE